MIELSIVMPCLNEARTVGVCIEKAQRFLREHQIQGEILIADNGSTDGSQQIAERLGARVVAIAQKGYGSALQGGITAARGRYIIMGDSDDSYDFSSLMPFVEQLRAGYDLVMGNRFLGGIKPGAMPALHRYLGNPILSSIGRLLFRSPCGDFHCGLRGFTKEAAHKMDLRTEGMEFASEMVVKATLMNLRITEVPTTLSPDGRDRPPHLRSWRDGWRHLRFLLLYCPSWLFLYPGLLLMALGVLVWVWLLPGTRTIAQVNFDVHTMLYAAGAVLLGFQLVAFWLFTKVFTISEGLLPEDPRLRRIMRLANLEAGLIVGCVLMALGIGFTLNAVIAWSGRPGLDPAFEFRRLIPLVVAITLGGQIVFSSFFLSVLQLRRRRG